MANKKRWHRREKDKGFIVLPFAISFQSRSQWHVKHTSVLTVHFLWWHWVWWFEREK